MGFIRIIGLIIGFFLIFSAFAPASEPPSLVTRLYNGSSFLLGVLLVTPLQVISTYYRRVGMSVLIVVVGVVQFGLYTLVLFENTSGQVPVGTIAIAFLIYVTVFLNAWYHYNKAKL